jgi:NAD(P)-dependent dehydrogenase (short-subunit alcohol dehydrogenase family)
MHRLVATAVEEQTILITGSTDGLGLATGRALARRGATVLVHGRDPVRGERARAQIADEASDRRARLYLADLSALDQVRALATRIAVENERLDVLVNNAGVALPDGERRTSVDGHELTFAVNYLSHFLLTALLLPLLERSRPARIVNVSSIGQAPVDFADVMLERTYDFFRAYRQSKLAQIMFTFELAARLDASSVTVNALHPATLMDTKMARGSFGRARTAVGEGVAALVRLVGSTELAGVTGRYFDGAEESAAHGQAYDRDSRRRLWELSERLCGLEPWPRGARSTA